MIATQTLAQIGVVQGGFLFIAILSRGWRKTGNFSLALLALIISIRLLPAAFVYVPENTINSWYFSVFNSLIFLFSPLLWIYVRNLTGYPFSLKSKKHIIPFALVLLIGLIVPDKAEQIMFDLPGVLIYPHITIYLIAMLIELRRFTRTARNYVSNPEQVELLWFRMLLLGSIILMVGNLLADFAFLYTQTPGWIVYLPFYVSNFFLFGIAYLVIRHPEAYPEVHETRLQIASHPLHGEDDQRYKKNRLDNSTELKILDSIIIYIETKELFRNDELRLSDLARETGYASNTISMVLNIHQQENFYQFINRYRIEAAKRALSDSQRSSESILEIAFNSGFRSKSTFNTVFRDLTGNTPSQYRSG